jgi:hypothetical protein
LPMDMQVSKRGIRRADENLSRPLQFGAAGETVVYRTKSQLLANAQFLRRVLQDFDSQPAWQELRIAGDVSGKVEELFAGPGQCPGDGITFHLGLCISAGWCRRFHHNVLMNINVTLDQVSKRVTTHAGIPSQAAMNGGIPRLQIFNAHRMGVWDTRDS